MGKVKKKSTIKIEIELDEHQVPEKIYWTASDNPDQKNMAAKGMLLSLFDPQTRETLKIDLWTKEMQVLEMDRFIYQSIRGLADTYFKATSNDKMASAMREFVQFFGEETDIIPKT